MNRARALTQLAVCLRGQAPRAVDWDSLLALANESLITPTLAAILQQQRHALPAEVSVFLDEIHARNSARNLRLFSALTCAVAALNGHGIAPILLKGCGTWVGDRDGVAASDGERIISDLDLLVRPCEAPMALEALQRAGFGVLENHSGEDAHVVAVLGRPQDAGSIDLHTRPPGPRGLAALDALHDHCRPIGIAGGRARLPRPELQILILCLHDQIHAGSYWMGGFSLRHLLDVARLTRGAAPIDWSFVRDACQTPFISHIVATQLVASARIADAQIPAAIADDFLARAHYLRLRLQYTRPALNIPLRWMGRLVQWRALAVRGRIGAASTARTRMREKGAGAPKPPSAA